MRQSNLFEWIKFFPSKEFFYYVLFLINALAPSVGLQYVYADQEYKEYFIEGGQYISFGILLFTCMIFLISLKKISWHYLDILWKSIKFDKPFLFFLICMLLGLVLSSGSFNNYRLFFIVTTLICFSCVLTIFLMERLPDNLAISGFILISPFFMPVLMAFVLEITGPVDLGVVFANTKHEGYQNPRWYFLHSSANGFGHSAAISFGYFFVGLIFFNTFFKRAICCLFLGICFYVLTQTGTRAAFIFALTFCFMLLATQAKMRFKNLIILGLFLVAGFGLLTVVFWEQVFAFLRLDGGLEAISSRRWVGAIELYNLFLASPLFGYGFGFVDFENFNYPTNLFYIAILVELGVLGAIGIFGLLCFPIFCFLRKIILSTDDILKNNSFLDIFSICLLVATLPYLAFEFNIVRVSAFNQLYFVCWWWVLIRYNLGKSI